jgi:ribosomal protein S12 methylthiotransferase accessory factor
MEKFEQADLHPVVREISSDFGVVCVIASAMDDWLPSYPQAHSGLGAHPTARIAVVRALTELAQSRAVDIQGVREDILAADDTPKEHTRHTQRLKRVDHGRWILRQEGIHRRFADVRSVEHADIADDIRWILSGLAGHGIQRVIVVDFTEPGGFSVVRVLVPGLEFWITDHGKLGTRALQFWKRHAAVA